jgi:uncharacterized membrane protein
MALGHANNLIAGSKRAPEMWAVMIIASFMLRLPNMWLILLSISLVIATELLLPELRSGWIVYPVPLRMWLLPGYSGNVLVLFPLMSWLGVTGIGMLFGKQLRKDPREVYAWMLGLIILWPLCLIYGRFKYSRPLNSIWRMF